MQSIVVVRGLAIAWFTCAGSAVQAQAWERKLTTDPITDEWSEAIYTFSTSSSGRRQDSGRLAVACMASQVTVVFTPSIRLEGDLRNRALVRVRVDAGAPSDEQEWLVDPSIDNSLRPPRRLEAEFLRSLLSGQRRIAISYVEPMVPDVVNGWNVFSLAGSTGALQRMRCFPMIQQRIRDLQLPDSTTAARIPLEPLPPRD